MATKNHEYERGYHEAREGRNPDDGWRPFTQLVTLGFSGDARENSDHYWEGRRDGREDGERSEKSK